MFTRIKKIESSANLVSGNIFKSYNLYNYSKTDASMSGNLISNLSYKIIPQTIDGSFNLSNSKYTIQTKDQNSVSSSIGRTKYFINSKYEVSDLTSNTITQSFGILSGAKINITPNLSNSKYTIQTKDQNSVSSSIQKTRYSIKFENEALNLTCNTITQSFGIFANSTISQFSSETIDVLKIYSLNDSISFGSAVKNVKISGTVVVSGNVVIGRSAGDSFFFGSGTIGILPPIW